jgi:UDP-N-acetylmuramoylalanine--D-glutamate ligase
MYMKGQKVLVLGLGKSGLAATRLLRGKGAEVVVRDDADSPALRQRAEEAKALGATVELGGAFGPTGTFHFCVLSPGINPRAKIVTDIARRGINVISEIELGYRFLKCPVVAVTGSNGKTTTTALIAHVLRAGGKRALAVGNVGYALCDAIAAEQMPDVVVIEVSSFQLETIQRFRPNVAVILNITPNHLDRYGRIEEYAAAKARVMRNMIEADTVIYKEECADFLAGELEACPARKVRFTAGKPLNGFEFGLRNDGVIVGGTSPDSRREPVTALSSSQLRGRHNAENIMAAAATALVFGVSRATIAEALHSFQPLPHRCEPVATVKGVQFVNDSKATSLDAVEKALSAFDAPVVLIAGGRNKGLDFHKLTPLIERRTKQLVLIGESSDLMARSWGRSVPFTQARTMEEAVQKAFAAASAGDVVLLSPACASFDMFESYEHRGDVFKAEVAKLVQEQFQS